MNLFFRNFKLTFIFVLLIVGSLFAQQKFYVNLNNRTDDTFKVTVFPKGLSNENNIFQFAATAPGTYQVMDIGRFVKTFKAYDKEGDNIDVKNISTNQWKISEPEDVYKITYTISETWDVKVKEHRIYPMAGTSIEDDNVLINGQAVFGYFKGKQSDSIYIKLEYPKDWFVGTALRLDDKGFYKAANYDYVVDSPILLGKLTQANLTIGNTNITVSTYSKSGEVKSSELLKSLKNILNAESEFLKGLPVKHYDFLFHFENFTAGAWEHSYSSEYIFKDKPLTPKYISQIRSIVAHEFFHVVTPLNIHSELVEKFNFVKPVMSQHLWLYEGVTEWASDIIQLRSGLISLRDYLNEFSKKLTTNDFYDRNISLQELGKRATELPRQYGNIYMKGAVTAALLDIKLLQLSHGKKGLRELIIELTKKYGKNHSFSEKNFFNELVTLTYPEIGDFINNYIKGTKPLPVKKYLNSIGFNYYADKGVDSSKASMGIQLGVEGGNFVIVKSSKSKQTGINKGDIIEKINGEKLTFKNARSIFGQLAKLKAGDKINIDLIRNSKSKNISVTLEAKERKHVIEINQNPTAEQLQLRNAWLKNL